MNRRITLAIGACLLFFPARLLACAVCLTGGANDPVQDAFNWSVLFLMAAPYTIAGSIGAWLFYRSRRSATNDSIFRLRWLQRGVENE
jgi:hypothetical protein